jgi:Ni,Fe-hydrogenase III large subunit
MPVLALTGGDIALIIMAGFWGLLVLFLCVVLLNTYRVLESTKTLIDGIRQETMPLLGQVTTTVRDVNRELDRVDGMLETTGGIILRFERVASLIEQAATGPLTRVIGLAAGVRKFGSRMGGRRAE